MQIIPNRSPVVSTGKIGQLAYSSQSSNLNLDSFTPSGSVPGISTTLETQGNPVFLTVQNLTVLLSGSGIDDVSCTLRVLRNGDVIYERAIRVLADGSTNIQFNEYDSFSFYDLEAPTGSNVYTMTGLYNTGSVSFRTIKLFAKEE